MYTRTVNELRFCLRVLYDAQLFSSVRSCRGDQLWHFSMFLSRIPLYMYSPWALWCSKYIVPPHHTATPMERGRCCGERFAGKMHIQTNCVCACLILVFLCFYRLMSSCNWLEHFQLISAQFRKIWWLCTAGNEAHDTKQIDQYFEVISGDTQHIHTRGTGSIFVQFVLSIMLLGNDRDQVKKETHKLLVRRLSATNRTHQKISKGALVVWDALRFQIMLNLERLPTKTKFSTI